MVKVNVYGNNYKNKYIIEAENGVLRVTDYNDFNPSSKIFTQINSIKAIGDKIVINTFDDVSKLDMVDETQYSYRTMLNTKELAEIEKEEVEEYVNNKTSDNARRLAKEIECDFIQA